MPCLAIVGICSDALNPSHGLTVTLIASGANGRLKLPGIVQEYRREYVTLSAEDKENIVKEYELHKKNKTFGYRVSARSKVSDVTQTLKRVEHEVCLFFASSGKSLTLCHVLILVAQ